MTAAARQTRRMARARAPEPEDRQRLFDLIACGADLTSARRQLGLRREDAMKILRGPSADRLPAELEEAAKMRWRAGRGVEEIAASMGMAQTRVTGSLVRHFSGAIRWALEHGGFTPERLQAMGARSDEINRLRHAIGHAAVARRRVLRSRDGRLTISTDDLPKPLAAARAQMERRCGPGAWAEELR